MGIGIILLFISSFFQESRNSLGKLLSINGESKNLLAIMSNIGVFIFFVIVLLNSLFLGNFNVDIFNLKFVILQFMYIAIGIFFISSSITLVKNVERTTHAAFGSIGFIFSLLVDILLLGNNISKYQILGIIIISLTFLLFNIGKNKTFDLSHWFKLTITIIIGASGNLLLKYMISDLSIPIELILTISSLFSILYFSFREIGYNKKNKLKINIKKINIKLYLIMIASTINVILLSYAFLYLEASVIQTLKSSLSTLYSIIFGFLFFKEDNFFKKIGMLIFLILGVSLIIFM